jgi:ferric-dicitrate binding protein FerR (iron transport regulator)
MDIRQIKELLQRYQAGSCTASEKELIEGWYERLIDTGEMHRDEGQRDAWQELIKARIMRQIDVPETKKVFFFKPLVKWWAAASVIAVLGVLSYWALSRKATRIAPVAKVQKTDVAAPASNKATVTLANGQQLFLDGAGNGALAVEGNVKVVKLANGEIAYQQGAGSASATEMVYNTLSNPRGSQVIRVVLADGTKVWLNAASSLRYPVSFIGKGRAVSITGEAYFEIADDASRPFVVRSGAMDVRVLGTHFNINAFGDNGDDIRVTLLEGSIRINSGDGTALVKPGQQAVVTKDIRVRNDVDLDQVMAWKNGYFQFDNAGLKSVLQEVSRWYDVDVIYEGYNRPRQFVGEIQRDLSLSEILKLLEKNKVRFKIEGKKLMVIPD